MKYPEGLLFLWFFYFFIFFSITRNENFLELSENENTIHPTYGTYEHSSTRQFHINKCLHKKSDSSHISNLVAHLNVLEQKEKTGIQRE